VSSPNLELVRSIYAAFERGDFSSAEWADPEIEYVIADGPSPGRWTGLQGMAEAWRGILSTLDHLSQQVEKYVELDHERVLVLIRNTGRAKASGIEIREFADRAAGLFHIRNGKVVRQVVYMDSANALADVGLSPEGGVVDQPD
jgi:ketosteroid isomerase-like protein